MPLKRQIYGLPLMRPYREWRTDKLSRCHLDHPDGFKFAGSPTFFRPEWEAAERALVRDQLRTATVFVDVGANQGYYSCLAASLGVAHVFAIEPESGNLKFLLSNLLENNFDHVEVFPIGISERVGITPIYGDGDMASLVPDWNASRTSFSQLIVTNTLDNLLGDRWPNERLLIKIDVEGLEYRVMKAAEKLLARTPKPAWLIENLPRKSDSLRSVNHEFVPLFELMVRYGYKCTRSDTGDIVAVDAAQRWSKEPGGLGNGNYLFV